jgi:hypothetical protein
MLGRSAPIARLSERLDSRAALLDEIAARPPRCAAALRLAAWAREPSFERRPPQRFIRQVDAWAREHGRNDLQALALWVTEVLAEFGDVGESSASDDAARLAFLHALASTDFPVLFLWSNPTLARHLFAADRHGNVELRTAAVASAKRLRRAALTAAAYVCGSMRRFAPRDAWVGVAFARQAPNPDRGLDAGESDTLARIDRCGERIALEPNLAWTERSWRDLPRRELASGVTPWQHVRARIASSTSQLIRERYEATLDELAATCERTSSEWLDFRAVDGFLTRTDSVFERTVTPEMWRADPHRWWIVRYVGRELAMPSAVARATQIGIEAAYATARERAITLGLACESPSAQYEAGPGKPEPPRVPLALRIAANAPHAILARADELTDWIVDASAAASVTPGFMPTRLSPHCAKVADIIEGGQRFVYAEPNPRRSAERFLMLPDLAPGGVAYSAFTGGLRALTPPRQLVDNRLVRLEEHEVAPNSVRPGEMVGLRSALVTDATQPLLALELACAAYRQSPEPLPRAFDPRQARTVSFGRVDPAARIWLLDLDDVRRLSVAVPQTRGLAAYFHLEIFELLGRPAWVEALVEGKRSAWPVSASVAFDILANAARTAAASIAILASQAFGGAVIRDERGDQIPAQVYLVGNAD